MRPFLVLVDLQNDFLADERLDPSAGLIVARSRRLLEGFRANRFPLAHVVTAVDRQADNRMPHWKSQGIWKCVTGTHGFKSPEDIAPMDNEPVIHKTWFNAFTGTALRDTIRDHGCDTLVVCGIHLHACVRETVMEAYSLGLNVIVASDAVGSYDPLHSTLSIEFLAQRAARFLPVAEIVQMFGDVAEPHHFIRHRSPRDPENEMWDVRISSSQEVDAASARAAQALAGWKATRYPERVERFMDVADRIDNDRDVLAQLMAREVGKPLRMGLQEVDITVQMIEAVTRRITTFLDPQHSDSIGTRVPLGVVALLTPWNNPLYIPLGKIVPAVLLGNTVVWKPSPQGQQVATCVMGYFQRAGLEGAIVQISGDANTGAKVMRAPSVNAVSLTGSSRAGYAAQAICGRRRIPVQAELGGNNAAIVWADADIDSAAERVAAGAFGFAGQRCTANRRAVVHESIYGRFLDGLLESTSGFVVGDPLSPEADSGPLISTEKCEQAHEIVERSRRAGAQVIDASHKTVGDVRYGSASCYFRPTVVCCDEPSAEIVQEEAFAPILVLQRTATWEDAIEKCNGVRQGLAAALFSTDRSLQDDFISRANTGIVKINESTAGASVDVPFGGWKSSGVGPAEHGDADIEFYTRFKSIYQ